MAISILNVTHHDAATSGNTNTISIPSTSVGSTLIVLVSTICSGQGFPNVDNVQDDEAIYGSYTSIAGARSTSTPSFQISTDIFYRAGVPAGLTTVNVYYSYNSLTSHASVIEVSGVNVASPVETSNVKTTTATTNNPVGNATTTAFTNALFVGLGITTTNNMNTLNNSWTRANTEITTHKQGYLIASGTTTMSINNTTSNSQTYKIATAVFNPTANTYTLTLTDSITPDSAIVPAASFIISKIESLTLSDSLGLILSTLNHFKTLFDTLVLSDSFSAVITFIRSLQETIVLTDSVTFVHESFRTLTDTVHLNDWLGIKRSGNHWGD